MFCCARCRPRTGACPGRRGPRCRGGLAGPRMKATATDWPGSRRRGASAAHSPVRRTAGRCSIVFLRCRRRPPRFSHQTTALIGATASEHSAGSTSAHRGRPLVMHARSTGRSIGGADASAMTTASLGCTRRRGFGRFRTTSPAWPSFSTTADPARRLQPAFTKPRGAHVGKLEVPARRFLRGLAVQRRLHGRRAFDGRAPPPAARIRRSRASRGLFWSGTFS